MGILICLFNICISLAMSKILFWCFKNTYLLTIYHYLVRTVVCMLLSSTIGTLYRANPLILQTRFYDFFFQAGLDASTRLISWDSEDFFLLLQEVSLENLHSLIVYCQHMWTFPFLNFVWIPMVSFWMLLDFLEDEAPGQGCCLNTGDDDYAQLCFHFEG